MAGRSVYTLLIGEHTAADVVRPTSVDWLDIIPSHISLTGAEIELVGMMNREYRLKTGLENIRDLYEYVLIDCPPSLGLLTVNALGSCDSILVPIQCEYFALEGLSQLVNTIRLIQKHINRTLGIEGVVLTMYDTRTSLSAEVAETVRAHFPLRVYRTIIPRAVRAAEAPSHGKTLLDFDRSSKVTQAYLRLAEEIIAPNDTSAP